MCGSFLKRYNTVNKDFVGIYKNDQKLRKPPSCIYNERQYIRNAICRGGNFVAL
jgi:hypothetical protein